MKSSCDDIILILIVTYVCYSTIAGGSSQHSAVVLFNVYVAESELSHFDEVSISALQIGNQLQFLTDV